MLQRPLGFLGVFRRHVVRDVWRHPLLTLLNVAAIALGSAVFLGIQTANQSAITAFAATVDFVSGKAHLEVKGRGQNIQTALWPKIRQLEGVEQATPLVEGVVTLPDKPGAYLRILGLDLFTHQPFSTFTLDTGQSGTGSQLETFLGTDRAVAITEAFAARHDLAIGDTVEVFVHGQPHSLPIVALIDAENAPPGADSHLAVMDIGWAQEILDLPRSITTIQLRIAEPDRLVKEAERLNALLEDEGIQVAPPARRSAQVQNLLMGFQLNLTALSLISLLVGVFLVYNTISASVVRRRHELGILRSIGASPLQVRALFLAEALLYGMIGLLLGIALGFLLAEFLSIHVAQTIRSLYVLVQVEEVRPALWTLLTTVIASLGAVLIGAWRPAAEAAGMPVVSALAGGRSTTVNPRKTRPILLSLGLALAAIVSGWAALHFQQPLLSFGTAFLALAAAALLAPVTTLATGRFIRSLSQALPGRGEWKMLFRLGCDNAMRSIHRNAVTVTALMAAVAMMIGVATMIHAFRGSVTHWIDGTMRADLFFTSAANEIGSTTVFLPPGLLERIETLPGIRQVDTYREWETEVDGAPAVIALVEPDNRQQVQMVEGDPEQARAAFRRSEAVMVTESFARKRQVSVGDTLNFPLGTERLALPIAGIYRDYTRDQGMVLFPFDRYLAITGDARVQSAAIHLLPDADPQAVADAIQPLLPETGRYLTYTRSGLRERVVEIFDQTFAVTYLLRSIAIAVAALGVVLTLSILVTEREREFGILRSVGMSRGQLIGMTVAEAVVLGLSAAVLGVVAGLALALILTYVVNVAFFGWTIAFAVPWGELIGAPFWIVATAALAACWPAWQATRQPISAAVRSE